MADTCATGKRQHRDRASAMAHLGSLRANGGSPDIQVYRCKQCKQWHVGHSSWALSYRIRQAKRRWSGNE